MAINILGIVIYIMKLLTEVLLNQKNIICRIFLVIRSEGINGMGCIHWRNIIKRRGFIDIDILKR